MIRKDDNELVYEVKLGSRSSFEELIERYQNKIFGMVLQMTNNRETAKDITQDVFVKAYTGLDRFDFRYRFFSWLYRIALNETLNHLKSDRKFESLEKVGEPAAEEEKGNENRERSQILRLSLRELKDAYRSVILLKYYFGLSYEEIAETEGISASKVKDRLFNARLALREKLIEKKYFENE